MFRQTRGEPAHESRALKPAKVARKNRLNERVIGKLEAHSEEAEKENPAVLFVHISQQAPAQPAELHHKRMISP